MQFTVLDLAIIVALIATLAYASYRDLKYRDIPELTWLPAAIIALAINLYAGNYTPIRTALSLLPPIMVLILAFLDMIGGADFLALLLIAIAHPRFILFPISLLTLFYSILIPLALVLLYFIINAFIYREELSKIRCVKGKKYYLYFLGRPMKIKEYLKSEFIYPLTIPKSANEVVFECRPTFSIAEEEIKHKEEIKKLIEDGLIDEDTVIWVTPALPHVAFIFIGYVIALITPQNMVMGILGLT